MTHSGGKPHKNVGDMGQRYSVTYYDIYEKKRKIFGWCTDLKGADQFCNSINLNPSMELPQVHDRELRVRVK